MPGSKPTGIMVTDRTADRNYGNLSENQTFLNFNWTNAEIGFISILDNISAIE